jgi:hypothetical protein
MVSTEIQKPQCPVCHKADKVKKLEAAYNEGMQRFAPPPLPGKAVPIARTMAFSMLLVGLFIFFILVLVGSESFGQGFDFFELALVICALVSIVGALVLSYNAIAIKAVHNDQESSKQYPQWDRAMEHWGRLRYCARDNVVFDPQTATIVSDEELASLMSTEKKKSEQQIAQQSTSLAN